MGAAGQAITTDVLLNKQQKVFSVLHVDDDVASLMMAESALEQAGFDVIHAENGEEAVQKFKDNIPDLIIMDAMMPVMDGFEAIVQIRKLPGGEHAPILMITGLDDVDSIRRAYDFGATDFLSKPISFFTLPYRMQYMLRAKLTADALRSSQTKLDSAQRIARMGHWECEINGDDFGWSTEFSRVMGLSHATLGGKIEDFIDRISPNDQKIVRDKISQALIDSRSFQIEFTLNTSDDNDVVRTVRMEAEPDYDEADRCTHLLGTVQDITERTIAHKQVYDLAYFDVVTGLPNRAHLYERLEQVLARATRQEQEFGILFLDLDHFKQVNDTLGHDAGDELLQQVSERLSSVIREADFVTQASASASEPEGDQNTVARLGGDEFVVLLGLINRAEDAARVADRIAEKISQPYTINNVEVSVTTTIGISVYPSDGDNTETLMKHADVAMYHAKQRGRNGYQFYSKEIHETALQRFSLEADLKQAIEDEALTLVYQPKVNLVNHEVQGVEALIRWTRKCGTSVSPAEFIPMAEENGLILPIGRWLLEKACVQMQHWIESGRMPFSVAVNCSPVQFENGAIISDIENALSVSGLDPRWLDIELTERLFLKDFSSGIATLKKMKALGVTVSIDDFGTGFSSLSYLKRLPVDRLKVDESFVRDLETDPGDAAIVSAIITLAHNLGLSVVAEGVETSAQLNVLERYGCDEAQGYFISHPLTSDVATLWLIQRERDINPQQVSGF